MGTRELNYQQNLQNNDLPAFIALLERKVSNMIQIIEEDHNNK